MKGYARVILLTTAFAYGVVVLGAYVRLSDAGLGCPDWPGCYGRLLVPSEESTAAANAAHPERPFEQPKAWKEMIHRYAAGSLGALIALIAAISYRHRHKPGQPLALPLLLVGFVVLQGLLGMWTVTLLLKPLIVVLHLLGGMTTLLLLWWLTLRSGPARVDGGAASGIAGWAILALVVVYLQIALGGWTSSNYAALACADFPTCHGQWWPGMDIKEGFTLWRGLGVNYEFGVLETPARTAIHVTHRLGAIGTAVVVGWLALKCVTKGNAPLQRAGSVLAFVLIVQLSLGVANVRLGLPLPLAVAHNAGAALLLLGVATVLYFARRPQAGAVKP
ncbi:MAG: COX15/CtaA family protein [Chromatiales bacterium]